MLPALKMSSKRNGKGKYDSHQWNTTWTNKLEYFSLKWLFECFLKLLSLFLHSVI